ncbi:MAG: hypothetical protein M3R04_03250 [bacterium]|nr:hypothetical protein [bacterium]
MSASRNFSPLVGSVRKGVVKLYGTFATTTSGTLSTTAITSAKQAGFTVTKTASKTGRYTIQLIESSGLAATYNALLQVNTTVIGGDDAALTTTKGLTAVVRDNDVATDGTFEVQFVTTNSGNADTELQDSASFMLEIVLANSTV